MAASQNTYIFLENIILNLLISSIKIKVNRSRIQYKLCKLFRKKKIAIRSSKYEQPLYNFFKNINFAFSP